MNSLWFVATADLGDGLCRARQRVLPESSKADEGRSASGAAFDRVVADVGAVAHWNERDRRVNGTVVTYPLDYPVESSVGVLFPDDSGLVFGTGRSGLLERLARRRTGRCMNTSMT